MPFQLPTLTVCLSSLCCWKRNLSFWNSRISVRLRDYLSTARNFPHDKIWWEAFIWVRIHFRYIWTGNKFVKVPCFYITFNIFSLLFGFVGWYNFLHTLWCSKLVWCSWPPLVWNFFFFFLQTQDQKFGTKVELAYYINPNARPVLSTLKKMKTQCWPWWNSNCSM